MNFDALVDTDAYMDFETGLMTTATEAAAKQREFDRGFAPPRDVRSQAIKKVYDRTVLAEMDCLRSQPLGGVSSLRTTVETPTGEVHPVTPEMGALRGFLFDIGLGQCAVFCPARIILGRVGWSTCGLISFWCLF